MFPFDLFKKKDAPEKPPAHNAIVDAFGKVKNEMSMVFSWINYLREKDMRNDFNHEQINYVLGQHDSTIESLKSEINELKTAVKEAKIGPFPDPERTKSEPKIRTSFEKKLIAQARPNKKDYILQQILDLANKKAYTTKQIEKIIVEEKGYCGRTTLYDYLRELRAKKLVKTVQIGSKKVLIEAKF
jgi:DNA polymerase III delta prime subunit